MSNLASALDDRTGILFRRSARRFVICFLILLAIPLVLLIGCSPAPATPTRIRLENLTIAPPPTSPVTPISMLGAGQVGRSGPGQTVDTPTPARPVSTPADLEADAPLAEAPSASPPPTSPVTPADLVTLATITPTPAPGSWRLYAGPEIPGGIRAEVDQVLAEQPGRFHWTTTEGDADVRLTAGAGLPIATWAYALVAPFATITDDVTLAEIQQNWQTGEPAPFVLTPQDALLLESWWGIPEVAPEIVQDEELIDTLWDMRPAWSIRPFDELSPELKVVSVDGYSPLDPEADAAGYPLALTVGISGEESAVEALQAGLPGELRNRDPGKMTRVAMTGVTALVRATAYQMELSGVLYPGEEVEPLLREADIAHISNEVAFAPDCPPPNPVGGTTFCSSESYFELLESLGTDVVEVTGNHVNDWGSDTFSATLDLYDAAGMAYFGGGRNLEDGATALFEHNGNRLAFVGCNPVGPSYAWSSAAGAGSQPCDYAALYDQIAALRDEGYLVIATQQYLEIYGYAPTAQQAIDFAELADAGAVAVSGSQGHHAQGFAFHDGAFIHYGLGNLFFDQMDMLGTRQSFVDTYSFYDGRLLNVTLWTGLIENFARPRLMTPDERAALLETVFQASGW